MVKSGSGVSTPFSLQDTLIVTMPCCPAAGPAMVLVTVSEPGTRSYVSVSRASTPLPPPGTVTCLAAAIHRDRHRAGVTVNGLRDGADAARSHQIDLGQLAGRAGSDRERRQVGSITGRLDHDVALLAGAGAGDRLLHDQHAGVTKL